MPNHCVNYIHLNADGKSKKIMKSLIKTMGLKDKPAIFDFNRLIPYPANLKEMDDAYYAIKTDDDRIAYEKKYNTKSDGFNNGGYNWCIENWDTKWNSYDVVLIEEKYSKYWCEASFRITTAWGCPEKVIHALAKLYPEISISVEWFERGNGSCGGFTCNDPDEENAYDDETNTSVKIFNTWQCAEYRGCQGG